jgi:hypothetical protein
MQALFLRIVVFTFMIVALCSTTAPIQAQPAQRCFNVPSDPNYNPDIQYCIEGPIRQYWESNGGLYVFGYPITTQHEEQVKAPGGVRCSGSSVTGSKIMVPRAY